MSRLYVRVSPIFTGYAQRDGGMAGHEPTGSIRISPAHTNPRCPFLNRSDRPEDHEVCELDSQLAEHPLFSQLGTCRHCVRRETDGALTQKRRDYGKHS